MVELIFLACLIATPDACEEQVMSFVATPSPVYCMVAAQPKLAEWASAHPNFMVKHWKCSTGRRPERA